MQLRPSRLRIVPARIALVAGLFGLSGITVLWGGITLLKFESTPGTQASTPVLWPGASKLAFQPGHPQLLVFAHPLCGCTAATLNELAQINSRLHQEDPYPEVTVLFVQPGRGLGSKSALSWNQALQIAHSTTRWDDEGREAKLFGAQTSGYVVLYNGRGELLFHGGVTGSRGHEGDNYGLDQLISTISTGRPASASHPVFGCGLLGSQMRSRGI